MTLRIGILVTNTDHSQFAKSQPTDGEKFSTLLRNARPHWTYNIYDCTTGIFPAEIDACDGYVIGGSPESVNGGAPWVDQLFELIRKFDAAKKPVVGCCFGHQAIAKALGGEVTRNEGGWAFGVSPTFIENPEAWMQPPANPIRLYAAHSEQVSKLPPQAEILGGSDFCKVGSFKIGNHIFTTEYHPEMTDIFFDGLTHAFEKYIGSEVASQARLQAKTAAQGPLFAEWMARFFELDRGL